MKSKLSAFIFQRRLRILMEERRSRYTSMKLRKFATTTFHCTIKCKMPELTSAAPTTFFALLKMLIISKIHFSLSKVLYNFAFIDVCMSLLLIINAICL